MKVNKLIVGILIFFIIISIFNIKIQANEFENFEVKCTEEFKKWISLDDSEKENKIMPSIYSIDLPNDYFENSKTEKKVSILSFFKRLIGLDKTNKTNKSKYNLKDYINIEVKDQGRTSGCWAFSILSAMETNMAIKKNEYKQFSERHMMYATARNFIDGENLNGLNKKVNELGLHEIGLAYLTNGQGAVLEKEMPFEDNEKEIYLSEINKDKDEYVTEYEKLPSIYKVLDENGNITYSNGMGEEYTKEQVNQIRNQIKQTIINYGGIAATMYSSGLKYYNNANVQNATAYFCNDNEVIRDHGITIIGWDDNYSKDNFNKNYRPKSDGAYIILNSYGEDYFENGLMYISYEDVLIENSLYAIKNTSNEEYNNLYQHDFFGGEGIYLGSTGFVKGYYANIYQRETKEIEFLDYVGVTVPDYVKLNIYVNPNGDSLKKDDLIKVGTTDIINPGYYKIKVNEIELKSDKFSIVVEQISENDRFYFSLEPNIPNTIYNLVSAQKGNSQISLDGNNWYDLSYLNIDSSIIDMDQSDVCIKGFTKIKKIEEPYLKSYKYTITEGYIKSINVDTTLEELIENINTNQNIEVYENNVQVKQNDVIKTGMELKVGNNTYILIVTGDINSDGKISLIDISKLILHYNEKELLDDKSKYAGDMNEDDKITLLDISKLIQIYNKIN